MQVRSVYRPLMAAVPVILFLYLFIPSIIFPAEDAAILFRYSENLAETGVICYNPGSERAEGATDFLWMLVLGLGNMLDIPVYGLSLYLSVSGLIGSYLIGYHLLDLSDRKPVFAWFWLFALLLSTQTFAAIQGFSVVFFGFCILLAVFFFQKRRWKPLIVSALLLALVRPDGLIIAVPLVIGRLILDQDFGVKKRLPLLLYGIIPGLVYFYWRYTYFGEFLPLPFYVKSRSVAEGQLLEGESVIYLLTYIFRYLSPLLIGLILGVLYRKYEFKREWIVLFVSLIAVPFVFYSSIQLEQNVAHRFAYPLLLGSLLLFLLVEMREKNRLMLIGIYGLLTFAYFFIYLNRTLPATYNNTPLLAKELSRWTQKRMAVTEAGRLPWYAGWECQDLWGLNTPTFSRNLPQKEDLSSFDPDLIMLDDGEWAIKEMGGSLNRAYFTQKSWDHMVFNSWKYAVESQNYIAWEVPFQISAYQPNSEIPWIAFLANTYKWLLGVSPDERRERYDLYLLKRNQADIESLQNILKKHGARRADHLMPKP